MDALALAVAAALLVVGAAAVVARRWRPAVAAGAVGLSLPAIVLSDAINAAPGTVALATLALPALVPIAGWGCTRPRPSVVAALVAGVVAGPVRALVYDPYYDLTCLTRCLHNPYTVFPLGHEVTTVLLAVGLAAPVALTWAAVAGPDRLPLGLLALSSWLVVAPGDREVVAAALAGGVLLVRVGVDVARTFDARARVADLARALRAPGNLEGTLRTVVGDPRLVVTYWLDDQDCFVAPDGRPTSGTVAGLVATDIRGTDGLVARFLHAPGSDATALADAVTGSARIALENGRLGARVRYQARQLEASRRRIVTDADAERRRLERDLHDGAQQHVLALGLEIRRALASATDAAERRILDAGLAATQRVLDELRDLSHGFYPSILDQSGLGGALEGVVDRSPVPLTVRAVPEARLPGEVERAIYLLVSRVAAEAARPLEVSVSRSETDATVVIRGARAPEGALPDVFAVLGGTLTSYDGQDVPVVQACLPLASQTEALR